MSKKMLTVFSALLVLVWPLIGGTLKDKGVTQIGPSHVSRVVAGNGAAVETDALVGPQNVRRPGQIYRFQGRDTADTLFYDLSFGGQFVEDPGDAMLLMFQMPADGIIKGVNVPVFEWGTGDQQLTISLHAVTYPYRSDGTTYPIDVVDGDGWIGGYDMDVSTGYMSISGTTYSPGGTQGICNAGKTVAAGAQDPLGDTPGTGTAVSTMGLLWPDGFVAATLDPTNNPAQQDNWLATADYGTEPMLSEGDWVGILVASTGTGGGDDPATGFFYAEGDGFVNPWVFAKFYNACGGTSGNGGWHIRHWVIDYELAVLLTGDRGPVMTAAPELPTTLSTADRNFTTNWTDDNPGGGDAGVATVTFNYMIDSTTATVNSITLTLTSGTAEDGTWSGTVPGQTPGTTLYYYLTAVDVGGKSTTTTIQQYYIFEPTAGLPLVFNNQKDNYDPETYYLDWTASYDVWLSEYGGISDELLNHYDTVIELAGLGPDYNNDDVIANWWDGSKTYIVSGDEWLGVRYGWPGADAPVTIPNGDIARTILGIDTYYSDINYGGTGDNREASRLKPVVGNAITGDLATFLSDSSVMLNYDPYYETGGSNWLDGVDPIDGFTVAMTAFAGILTSADAADPDTTEYNVMIFGQHGNGGVSVFMGFDVVALNTAPDYYWVGAPYVNDYYAANFPQYGFKFLPTVNVNPLLAALQWVGGVTGVDDGTAVPNEFALKGNYPNPFNPSTNIAFTLDVRSDVTVRVYSLLGKEVATLHSGNLTPGLHSVQWNGLDSNGLPVASGVYLYRVEAGSRALTGKMMLLK